MKVVALIHAKKNNARLSDKHLRPVNGMPLIEHVICHVAGTQRIDDVVLSTDDDRMIDIGLQYDCRVEKRDEYWASDRVSGYEALRHTATWYMNVHAPDDDVLWLGVMGNCVFVRRTLINDFVEAVVNRDEPRSVCVVRESHRYPQYAFTRRADGVLSTWTGAESIRPSTVWPQPWFVDGILYGWKKSIDVSYPLFGFPVERWEYVHVHDQFDLDMAEWLLSRR